MFNALILLCLSLKVNYYRDYESVKLDGRENAREFRAKKL